MATVDRQGLSDTQRAKLAVLAHRIAGRFYVSTLAQFSLDERFKTTFGQPVMAVSRDDFPRALALLEEIDVQTEKFHASILSVEQTFVCLTVWGSVQQAMESVSGA